MALSSFLRAYAATTVAVSDRPSVSLKFSNIFLSENNNSRYGPSSPTPPEDLMAECSRTAPRLLRSRSYVHRFVGAADARIDTESRRPIEGEGNFPLFKALKSHKTRKLLPRTPRQGSAPLRNPQHRRRLDGVARVLFDRSSFGICSNSESRRPNGEEENYPPCKALKSPRMRKSLPRHPWRDSPPSRNPQPRTASTSTGGAFSQIVRK
jgi:hypothetical protein